MKQYTNHQMGVLGRQLLLAPVYGVNNATFKRLKVILAAIQLIAHNATCALN